MRPIPQSLTFRLIALSLVLGALASGCGPGPEKVAEGDDPLAALAVAAQSERYDGRFWRLQHSQRPDLYGEAVAYCQGEQEAGRLETRPNCTPVLQAKELIDSMNQPRREGRGYTGILEEDAADSAGQVADTTAGDRQR